jgi:hypothetical protein
MMDCRGFRERLTEFLDRQLAAPETSAAETHMSGCPGCRSEFEELKGVSKMIGSVGRQPLPAGFMQRLERRRRAQDETPAPSQSYSFLPPGLPRYAAFALSSLIVAMVVVDKTKNMMAPPQGMISGAASKLDGGAGGGGFDGLKKKDAKVPSALNETGSAGESVNQNTLAMLQAAAANKPYEEKAATNAGGVSLDDAAAMKDEKLATGSVTSTGKALAKARGEPIDEQASRQAAELIAKNEDAEARALPTRRVAKKKAAPAAPAAAAPDGNYTNEELAANIEQQKKQMGIVKIIPPGNRDERLQTAMLSAFRGGSTGPEAQLLRQAEMAPASLGAAQTPGILGGSGTGAARGAAFGSLSDKRARLDELPGVVIRSDAERQDLWHKYQLAAPVPKVDYATQMLAVVFATSPSTSVQISGVAASEDRILISFHELPSAKDASSGPAVALRVIPRTQKPVVFERLP